MTPSGLRYKHLEGKNVTILSDPPE